MTDDPVLAELEPTEGWPRGFRVEGGLHMIRSNHAPYFSLTYTEPGPDGSGGAGHDTILQHFPELADIAALHLSDIDGVPMHAEANGWYWLAGSLGGLGATYHGGNSLPRRSEAECLDVLAKHCRINGGEARTIRSMVSAAYIGEEPGQAARAKWGKLMESMRPRWKREAEAAIERHGLTIYGDPWPPSLGRRQVTA